MRHCIKLALVTKRWCWVHHCLFVCSLGCSVVRGQYLAEQRGVGRGGVGGGVGRAGHNTLLPAVSSLTLHFLPTHTLTSTAAITVRRLQEHKIWLISLTNQPGGRAGPFTPQLAPLTDLNCVKESRPWTVRLWAKHPGIPISAAIASISF